MVIDYVHCTVVKLITHPTIFYSLPLLSNTNHSLNKGLRHLVAQCTNLRVKKLEFEASNNFLSLKQFQLR